MDRLLVPLLAVVIVLLLLGGGGDAWRGEPALSTRAAVSLPSLSGPRAFEAELLVRGPGGEVETRRVGRGALLVSPAELEQLRPTGDSAEVHGLRFERLVASDPASELRELWWNAEHELPWKLVRDTERGPWTQELVALR